MNFAVLCFFFISLTLLQGQADGTDAESHNMEWGTKETIDHQLYGDIVTKEYSFARIVTQDVPFEEPTGSNITYIKATDQYTNGNGGYATLLSGGVGYKDVTLHLKSQRNHGFNFIIEIFGHN